MSRSLMVKIFTSIRTLLSRIVLVCTVLCALGEFGLRFGLGLGSPVLYVENVDYGYFPAASLNLKRFGKRVSTNQLGMRSPDFTPESPTACSLMFLGDSVTFGTTLIDQDAIFVSLVGKQLKEGGTRWLHILNASAPGWAPENILGYLRVNGIYHSQTVVIVINSKDLTQLFAHYQESTVFPKRRPVLALQELLMRYILPRLFPSLAVTDPGSTEASAVPGEEDRYRLVSVLSEIARLVRLKGGQPVLVYVPSFTNDIQQNFGAWQAAAQHVLDDVRPRFSKVVDLRTDWRKTDYAEAYLDGIHLSKQGNQLMADVLVPVLQGLHPCRPHLLANFIGTIQSK